MSTCVAARKKKVFGCVRELWQRNKSDLCYLRPVDRLVFLKNLKIQLELLPQVVPDGKVNVMIKNSGVNEADRL